MVASLLFCPSWKCSLLCSTNNDLIFFLTFLISLSWLYPLLSSTVIIIFVCYVCSWLCIHNISFKIFFHALIVCNDNISAVFCGDHLDHAVLKLHWYNYTTKGADILLLHVCLDKVLCGALNLDSCMYIWLSPQLARSRDKSVPTKSTGLCYPGLHHCNKIILKKTSIQLGVLGKSLLW